MSAPDAEPKKVQRPEAEQKEKEKKKKLKKSTSQTKESESGHAKDEKPKIKKRLAKAQEIEKTQSKRLVKTKRSGKRKVVRVSKTQKVKEPEKKARDIGVEVVPPTDTCTDPNCPFHGTLSVRGQILTGIIISSKMDKTAVVQREVLRFVPKYERYEKRTHRYSVHNPQCLNVSRGDMVKIMECRPISKSKSFVVIEKM